MFIFKLVKKHKLKRAVILFVSFALVLIILIVRNEMSKNEVLLHYENCDKYPNDLGIDFRVDYLIFLNLIRS